MSEPTFCKLHGVLGGVEACPGGACAFWEDGGAALEPGCSIERLAIDVERADVAEYLLELRAELEAARGRDEQTRARHAFAALVPPGLR